MSAETIGAGMDGLEDSRLYLCDPESHTKEDQGGLATGNKRSLYTLLSANKVS